MQIQKRAKGRAQVGPHAYGSKSCFLFSLLGGSARSLLVGATTRPLRRFRLTSWLSTPKFEATWRKSCRRAVRANIWGGPQARRRRSCWTLRSLGRPHLSDHRYSHSLRHMLGRMTTSSRFGGMRRSLPRPRLRCATHREGVPFFTMDSMPFQWAGSHVFRRISDSSYFELVLACTSAPQNATQGARHLSNVRKSFSNFTI